MREGANKRSPCSWPRPPARHQRCTPAHGATPGARSPSAWQPSSPASACSASAWRSPTRALPLTGPTNQPRIGRPVPFAASQPVTGATRTGRLGSGLGRWPAADHQAATAESGGNGVDWSGPGILRSDALRTASPGALLQGHAGRDLGADGCLPRRGSPRGPCGDGGLDPASNLDRLTHVWGGNPRVSLERAPVTTGSRARSSAPGKSREAP